tara:strand:+ start:519 stop:800 length:282 start_codon:yes stop_codon:yes gene_type:complete
VLVIVSTETEVFAATYYRPGDGSEGWWSSGNYEVNTNVIAWQFLPSPIGHEPAHEADLRALEQAEQAYNRPVPLHARTVRAMVERAYADGMSK